MAKKLTTLQQTNASLQDNASSYNPDTTVGQAMYAALRRQELSGGVNFNADVQQTGPANMKKQPATSVRNVSGKSTRKAK